MLALLTGFALLATAIAGTAWLAQSEQRAADWVAHTLSVEDQLDRVLSRLQDEEIGERGFLLTARSDFLQPYDAASANLASDLLALQSLIADNPAQRDLALRLQGLAAQRQTVLQEAIDRFRQGDRSVAIDPDRMAQAKLLMDQARNVIATMRMNEATLLAERKRVADWQAELITIGLVVTGLLVVALASVVFSDARRRFAQVSAARDGMIAKHNQLLAETARREAAEAQVMQMQRLEAVGQLTGGIAHDFNNMLAVILGSLELAKRRLDSDRPKAEKSLESAANAARRAALLTTRLLAFSRRQALEPRVLDLNRLVGGMSELMQRILGERIQIETVLAGDLWRVFADPAQLESAILNLCVNARDAMDAMAEGGRLTIETANAHLDDAYAAAHSEVTAGQYAMISVSDSGTGMAAEIAAQAFDPFFTTKPVGKGTGLGLSQVHGFIKQSDGHVKIYSEPGVGTTVKIYLPRHVASEKLMEAAGTAAPIARARGEEVILVVEDEESVRQVSVDALRELGYAVVEAADPWKALEVLRGGEPVDLLFTDVVMPEMSGSRLAEQAAELRPGLRVLYTTGYTRNAVVHNGVLDADVAFLPKPFTIEQLATKVRHVLAE